MIIKYYGGYVKKENLINLTKTDKKGTTAYNIKKGLEELGFSVKGVRCNLNNITKDNVILPCIANVIINNSYKHFIVIYEINYKKKYLVIGDPADKIKKISFQEFNKIFNNVLIILYPIKTLPIEKNVSYKKFIYLLVRPHKKILMNIFILSIFITILSILTSFYTEYMFSSVNYYSKYSVTIIFCTFFSIYLFKNITHFFRNKLLLYISQKIDLSLTLDIFNKIIELPYTYYQNRTTGDIISRINDLDSIKDIINRVALSIFVDLPLTLLSFIVLFIISKTLCLIGFIILVFYFIIIILFKSHFNEYIRKIQIEKGITTSTMVESISGFETIKGMHIEKNIENKFEKKYVKLLKESFNYQNLYFLQFLFKELVDNIGFILIIFVGCILAINGEISTGSLLSFSSLLIYFLEPIKNIINLDTTLKEANNSLKRILDIVSYENKDTGIINKFECGDISVNNLSFSFNDRDYILKGVNIVIKNKSKVMVVGKSGSGKSTLFKILMKYYKINNNKVFINNIDLNNYDFNCISNNILYLGQNEILFNDTLYNNLNFDNKNSSKFLEICKLCFVDEIIDSNLGYNMMIEENGFNLSGGEKQRILLSRALLRNFNILIIDEGLSQVDIDMERRILKNIFNRFKDKTIVFISHRLDNLDLFDNLIRFKNGEIYSEGRNG